MNEDQLRAAGRLAIGGGVVRAGFAGLLLLCASSALLLWPRVGPSGGSALQRLRAASDGATARLQQQIAASLEAAPVAPVRAARAPREWGLAWEAVGPFAPKGGAEIKGKWQLAEALERKLEFTRAEFDQFAVSPLKHNAYIKARGRYCSPRQSSRATKRTRASRPRLTSTTPGHCRPPRGPPLPRHCSAMSAMRTCRSPLA